MQRSLAVQSTPVAGVAVTGTSAGTTNYTASCNDNSQVTLTAPAAFAVGQTHYTFVNWTVAAWASQRPSYRDVRDQRGHHGRGPYQIVQRSLTVQSTPVTGVPITGTPRRDHELHYFLRRQLAGDPDGAAAFAVGQTDYAFVKWTVARVDQPDTQATVTFAINADTTAVAQYQIVQRSLTVQSAPCIGVPITGTPGGTTNYAASCDDNSQVDFDGTGGVCRRSDPLRFRELDGGPRGSAEWPGQRDVRHQCRHDGCGRLPDCPADPHGPVHAGGRRADRRDARRDHRVTRHPATTIRRRPSRHRRRRTWVGRT